jgi:hypothetical protein
VKSARRRDFDFDETCEQFAQWAADRENEARSRCAARFPYSRSLGTNGCMVYFFFASIALLLLELAVRGT